MAYTTIGLANNGRTAHYQISYDPLLPNGLTLATGLVAACEQDLALMQDWFSGVNFIFDFPLPVQIANASGGASWNDPSDWQVQFGASPSITISPINPGVANPVAFVRYLLVSEVTEMFMASQKKGWYQDTSLFSGADEGSKGEGLSRFLGMQFLIANGFGSVPPVGFGITYRWLNSPRQDFVNNNPDDNQPDPTNGCTTLFLYYLHTQLGKTVKQIVAAGSSNLAGVYKKLTGQPDGWTPFSKLVNDHYPPGFTYNPKGDDVFPVSNLSQFFAPNQITTGYSESTLIFIDRPAMAEVNIKLTSDNPALVQVPPIVTIPVGASQASVNISSTAIAGPFPTKFVNVHASYAGTILTISAEVVPPRVISLTLSPDTVICGDNSEATITLDRPSLLGPVMVDLVNGAPGFATIPPTPISMAQKQVSIKFPITTPNIAVPFKTAHASIYASYSGSSASASLTVKSRVVAGILNSLVLFPNSVAGGNPSTGTVTLVEAVPVNTVVGLAAMEPGPLHPPQASSVASVPKSITIPAGATSRTFQVTTNDNLFPGTTRKAQIVAGAVVTKFAILTVSA